MSHHQIMYYGRGCARLLVYLAFYLIRLDAYTQNVDLTTLIAPTGFTIAGAAASDQSGFSVNTLGDVNGDGVHDMIVGSNHASPLVGVTYRSQAGVSYIIFGRKGTSGASSYTNIDLTQFAAAGSSLGFAIYGVADNDWSGNSVSGAGDVNGDGIRDIIVGAPGSDRTSPTLADVGMSYVIFGRNASAGSSSYTNIDLSPLVTSGSALGFAIIGAGQSDTSGRSVGAAGDVNSDGLADVIIGAYLASPSAGTTRTNAGMSYVVFGRSYTTGSNAYSNIDLANFAFGGTVQGYAILGATALDNSGWYVNGAGDVNGDGASDVIVGANMADAVVNNVARADSGISYVLFGRKKSQGVAASYANIDLGNFATAGTTAGFAIFGSAAGDQSGISVSTAGDVNKDGIADVIVGAFYANPVLNGTVTSGAGMSYVIFGRAKTDPSYYTNVDLLPLSTAGSALGFAILGAAQADQSGRSVSKAGDVNGDGVDDVIVGAYGADRYINGVYADAVGVSHVVFGRAASRGAASYANVFLGTFTGVSSYGFQIVGAVGGDYSGYCVSAAGDVNKDGIADVLVGAYPAGGTGRSYVVFGATSAPTSQPSSQPSRQPSAQPSRQPSRQPTRQPSSQPSRQPSARPSAQPSMRPSAQPTSRPSSQPSSQPSRRPSAQPSAQPSRRPSAQPTSRPSGQPSVQPSAQPSSRPVALPTSRPSSQPSSRPSGQPVGMPSAQPSVQPSSRPSRQPSAQPTARPSSQPSTQPSAVPSVGPSSAPSSQPSEQPSSYPSRQPSGQPSSQPSVLPSQQPTAQPTVQPSAQPSNQPSARPSLQPAATPTVTPSGRPSVQPSSAPSAQPSVQPSAMPSTLPSSRPSAVPSAQPVAAPSAAPSSEPSGRPTNQPSSQPSAVPSCQPSAQPSAAPSGQPIAYPSARPISEPSTQPTSQPSKQPSAQPSPQPSSPPSSQPFGSPTTQPTGFPSSQPSTQPTAIPSSQPTSKPSDRPSGQPMARPTSQPSAQPSSVTSAQPSQQPRAAPSGQPTAAPSARPTLAPTGEWATVVSQTSQLASVVNPDGRVWACEKKASSSSPLCVLADATTGIIIAQYQFAWTSVTSVFATSAVNSVVINGHSMSRNVMTNEVATCTTADQDQLHCAATSFQDTTFLAASYVPYPNKIVFVGWYNVHTNIVIQDVTLGSALSYLYTASNMKALTLSQVQSPPSFVGSFVAGTTIRATASPVNYIVAGMVRTDGGILKGMIFMPQSGNILNNADLVNAMALEYTGPDSFIAGALQLADVSHQHAYLLRANALYNTISYCVRYRNLSSDRRALSTAAAAAAIVSQSVVRGMVLVDTTLFMIVDHTVSNVTSLTVLKTSASDGVILKQVHVTALNATSLNCTDISISASYLNIVCTYANASLLLSVDQALSFAVLPVGFERSEETIFEAETIPFQRTVLTIAQTNAVAVTSPYEFDVTDQGPTRQPSLAPSYKPFSQPSSAPSAQPSSSPTASPSVSARPTSQPSTSGPTITYRPTIKPTTVPSRKPSIAATARPSLRPTVSPSALPTVATTRAPTAAPTARPSAAPSTAPMSRPSARPTSAPTVRPSSAGTSTPTVFSDSSSNSAVLPPYVVGASVGGGLALLLLAYVVYRYRQHEQDKKEYKQRMDEYYRQQAILAEQERSDLTKFVQTKEEGSDSEEEQDYARTKRDQRRTARRATRARGKSTHHSVRGAYAVGSGEHEEEARTKSAASAGSIPSSDYDYNVRSLRSSERSSAQIRHHNESHSKSRSDSYSESYSESGSDSGDRSSGDAYSDLDSQLDSGSGESEQYNNERGKLGTGLGIGSNSNLTEELVRELDSVSSSGGESD